ncbi:MAG TPA: DegT/DnrJ/EryC1/StrS family aminotransferase [Candidatus Elarobacter sp.]
MTTTAADRMTLPSDQDASGRTLGQEELALLADVITSGTLNSTKGTAVAEFERALARTIGVKHVIACASGSAAVHCAIAALNPEPGDEIVTTAITDMGALAPILYQGAIPVFADVDPRTCNVTAATVAARITPRTRAIVATHLFGNPCEMAALRALADERGVMLIEDSAQAYLATVDGRAVGTWGDVACFSLQQGKHITTGEGGFVATNDDALARRMWLFVNKAWGYGDPQPDHYFLALNYRLTELQGAVGLGQLPKLEACVEARQVTAAALTERIGDVAGITAPVIADNATHAYWKYIVMVDPAVVPGGSVALGAKLKERGIASAPRYIQKPAFQCAVFRDRVTLGTSGWPFTLADPAAVDYDPARFPGTFRALEHVLVLPWNERYTTEHVDFIARALRDAVAELRP